MFCILAVWVCSQMEGARTRCKVDASSQPEKTWLPFGILSCNGEKDQAVLCQQSHCTPSQSSAVCLYSWQINTQTGKVKVKAVFLEHTHKIKTKLLHLGSKNMLMLVFLTSSKCKLGFGMFLRLNKEKNGIIIIFILASLMLRNEGQRSLKLNKTGA